MEAGGTVLAGAWAGADAPRGVPGFTSTLDPSTVVGSVEPDHHRDHHRKDHERATDQEDSLTCTHAEKCTPVWPRGIAVGPPTKQDDGPTCRAMNQ